MVKNLKASKKTSFFLNIRTMHFDQSSPVQPNLEKKIFKKSQKITFFKNKKKLEKKNSRKEKKKSAILLVFQYQGGCDSTRAFQYSPFQVSGGVVRA